MSYYVLARKWRPQMFNDLIGQQHVVKSLSYALSNDQVHHAYLFTGTRGVGKTSIARIFAKSLNCLTNGVSANSCGQCEHCLEISEGKFVDLIEVDAASRTGIEDTRELIDSIPYLPTKGRCKVYLIDEVHMFSNSSFNALLKTLEEPPEHVKFILATTDPDKLPITILSRCLQFNLKSLTKAQLVKHLEMICEKESISFEQNALTMLAEAGAGSVRDTLSITDQALAYGQGKLGLETVSEILGTTRPADIESIVFAIAINNPTELHKLLIKLDDYDIDAKMLLTNIMRLLQSMAWMKEGIVREISPVLQGTLTDIPKSLLHLWYDIAANGLTELSNAQDEKSLIDMVLLRMCAFVPDNWNPRKYTPVSVNNLSSDVSDDNTLSESPISDSSEKQPVVNNDEIKEPQINQQALTEQKKSSSNELSAQNEPAEAHENDTFEIKGFANTLHAQPAIQSASLSDAEDVFIHQSLENPNNSVDNFENQNIEMDASNINLLQTNKDATHKKVVDDSVASESLASESTINENVSDEIVSDELKNSHQPVKIDDLSKDFFSIDLSKMESLSPPSSLINEDLPPWEEDSLQNTTNNQTININISSLSNDINQPVTDNTSKEILIEKSTELSQENLTKKLALDENLTEGLTDLLESENNKDESDSPLLSEQVQKSSSITPSIAPLDKESSSVQQDIEDKVNTFDWYQMIEALPFKPLIRHCLSMGVLSVSLQKTANQSFLVNTVFNISSHNSVLLTEQVTEDLIAVLNSYFDCPVKVVVNQTELSQPVPMEINQQKESNQQEQLVTKFNQLPEVNKLVDQLGVEVLTNTIKKVTK